MLKTRFEWASCIVVVLCILQSTLADVEFEYDPQPAVDPGTGNILVCVNDTVKLNVNVVGDPEFDKTECKSPTLKGITPGDLILIPTTPGDHLIGATFTATFGLTPKDGFTEEDCPDIPESDTQFFTIKAFQVKLEALASSQSPDISPLICLNAQDAYKKTKWKATVLPDGMADVEVSDQVSSNKTSVSDDEVIELTGSETGQYTITLSHNSLSSCSDSGTGDVFQFVGTQVSHTVSGRSSAGSTIGGTPSSSTITIDLPGGGAGPSIPATSATRSFTTTIGIDVVGTNQFSEGLSADVTYRASEDGTLLALSFPGFKGIGPLTANISSLTTIKLNATGASITGQTSPNSASAPQSAFKLADVAAIGGALEAVGDDVVFTGAFPRTITGTTTASAEATVDILQLDVGVATVEASGKAKTTKPYQVDFVGRLLSDFKITALPGFPWVYQSAKRVRQGACRCEIRNFISGFWGWTSPGRSIRWS